MLCVVGYWFHAVQSRPSSAISHDKPLLAGCPSRSLVPDTDTLRPGPFTLSSVKTGRQRRRHHELLHRLLSDWNPAPCSRCLSLSLPPTPGPDHHPCLPGWRWFTGYFRAALRRAWSVEVAEWLVEREQRFCGPFTAVPAKCIAGTLWKVKRLLFYSSV